MNSEILIHQHIEAIQVSSQDTLFHVMKVIEQAPQHQLPSGIAVVVSDKKEIIGVVTDGDIRTALIHGSPMDTPCHQIMTLDPIVVPSSLSHEELLPYIRRAVMRDGKVRGIRHAIVGDQERQMVGLIDVGKLAQNSHLSYNRVAVIGLGYVGLTLALSLAESQFEVYGYDVNTVMMDNLRKGISHIHEPGIENLLQTQLAQGRFILPTQYEELKTCQVFIIAVHTPVLGEQVILTHLANAITDLSALLQPGSLVILRSTVRVGTNREVVQPIIESNTPSKVGKEIGLAFAPERTIQGNALAELRALPQIIGAVNEWSYELTSRIFSRLGPSIVRADSIEEAEIIKLINNAFRDLSFAFANEIALMCDSLNLDASHVIQVANSGYPRNPIAFPSPGVGGACLTKDPYILSASHQYQIEGQQTLSKTARRINELMPQRIAERLLEALQEMGKNPAESRLLIMGIAFKGHPETNDLRGSTALDFIAIIRQSVSHIVVHDPIVPVSELIQYGLEPVTLEDGFMSADAVLIFNNHRNYALLNLNQLLTTLAQPAIFFDGWKHFSPRQIEPIAQVRYMSLGYLTPWIPQSEKVKRA